MLRRGLRGTALFKAKSETVLNMYVTLNNWNHVTNFGSEVVPVLQQTEIEFRRLLSVEPLSDVCESGRIGIVRMHQKGELYSFILTVRVIEAVKSVKQHANETRNDFGGANIENGVAAEVRNDCVVAMSQSLVQIQVERVRLRQVADALDDEGSVLCEQQVPHSGPVRPHNDRRLVEYLQLLLERRQGLVAEESISITESAGHNFEGQFYFFLVRELTN